MLKKTFRLDGEKLSFNERLLLLSTYADMHCTNKLNTVIKK